jgi:hypothetical protein
MTYSCKELETNGIGDESSNRLPLILYVMG